MIKNTDLVKKILTTILNISSRKTNKEHAVTIMDSLLKKLEIRYSFLKHIELKDNSFLEDADMVSVMSDLNTVSESKLGQAIHEIIFSMNQSLGKNAGFFFYKEISRGIDGEYQTTMRDLGVDLGLMQLESEVEEMEKNMFSSKKSKNVK